MSRRSGRRLTPNGLRFHGWRMTPPGRSDIINHGSTPLTTEIDMAIPPHPHDAGAWSRLEGCEGFALWRRERRLLAPVTMYYVVAPPRQSEILYDEAKARARYQELATVPETVERRQGAE